MPSYVIGLDLGQRSVKAAVLKGALRGYEVEDFLTLEVEHELPATESSLSIAPNAENNEESVSSPHETDGEDDVGLDSLAPGKEPKHVIPQAVLTAAQRLLESIALPQATVVVAVPGERLSSWVVSLPFNDASRIAQTVEFEVESFVPWDLDEVIFDYQALDGETDETKVLTAMVPIDTVDEILESLRGVQVEPTLLGAEPAELAHLLPDTAGCEAVVDIGATRTLICLVSGGRAAWFRTVDLGSEHLTDAPEGKTRWLAALRSSLIAAEEKSGLDLNALRLVGGGSRDEGLLQLLSDDLGVDVSALELPPCPKSPVSAPRAEPEHALAYALALKGFTSRRDAGLNFRKGPFVHKASGRLSVRLVVAAIAAMLIGSVSFIGMHFVQMNKLQTDLEDRTTQLRSTVLDTFPDVSEAALATSDGAISVLQEQVYGLQWRVEALEGHEHSSLTLLRELSNAVPGDLVVDVDEYVVNDDIMKIRGITDSFGSVDKIEAAILEKDMFRGAKKSDVNKSRDGKMRFNVTVPRVHEDEEVEG